MDPANIPRTKSVLLYFLPLSMRETAWRLGLKYDKILRTLSQVGLWRFCPFVLNIKKDLRARVCCIFLRKR